MWSVPRGKVGRSLLLWVLLLACGGGVGGPVEGESEAEVAESWTDTATVGAPAARSRHAAVWTGSEMVVWGGWDGLPPYEHYGDGGRYDPFEDAWRSVALEDAPAPRAAHTALWTGSRMIVWGGAAQEETFGDGAGYDPETDTWTPIAASGALAPRGSHVAVWIGSEMIVWGGRAPGKWFADGARYRPDADQWSAISSDGAPSLSALAATWTGSEMLVCGAQQDWAVGGSRYDPTTGTWAALPTEGAPRWSGDLGFAHTWTGAEWIFWGYSGQTSGTGVGGRYHRQSNSWRSMDVAGAPDSSLGMTAVWSGSEAVFWGGQYFFASTVPYGSRYDPSADVWQPIEPQLIDDSRSAHTAVWTGTEMIVWGGFHIYLTTGYPLATGLRYVPGTR